ncbi:hypothetical protein D3C84_710170 [compost metagenome]
MAQQHQAQTTVDHFLVNCHVFEKIGFSHLFRRDDRQAGTLEQANAAIALLLTDPAQTRGHFQRHYRTGSDRFTMQPDTIAHVGFDGVAERVAQVQRGANTGFLFIGADHRRLRRAGALDGIGQGDLVQGAQAIDVFFEPGQEGLVADQAVFDDFSKPGGQLAGRQGIEGGGIDQHHVRLIEGADHVFAQRMIDPGLAAHRGVDLRQQSGWNLDEIDATLVTGGGKTGHVANHAATEGDHRGATVVTRGQQAIKNQLQGFPGLEGFAIGKHHGDHRELRQAAGQTLKIKRRNGFVGDDRHLPSANVRGQQLRLIQQTFANMNRVAALA